MEHAVIAGYVRSPFTFADKGELTRVRPDELAAQVIKELVWKRPPRYSAASRK